MLDIGIGLSLEKNAVLAAEEALREAKRNKKNSAKIDLALAFSSCDLSAPLIAKTLNNLLSQVHILGANGAAIISEQGIFKHGLIVMLLSLPPGVYFTTAQTRDITTKTARGAGSDLGEKLLYGFKNIPRSLGLLFFDRLIEDGADFIFGLQEHLGRSFPCIGASGSDVLHSLKTSLFSNQGVISDGCCAMLWGGKLAFGLSAKHGWKPLGKPHTISSAQGNTVYKIDGRPAVELYQEYLSSDAEKLKKELKQLSIYYPIGIFIPGEAEYLLRNTLRVGEDGSLLCQGNVPEGSTIRLMISTRETCLEATRQASEEAQKSLSVTAIPFSKEKTSRMAIAFISVSRYNLLRREAKKELEIIRESIGAQIPILGLYTYGELAPLMASSYRGQIYFHNQTVTVALIEG